jgi:hypothetical protein
VAKQLPLSFIYWYHLDHCIIFLPSCWVCKSKTEKTRLVEHLYLSHLIKIIPPFDMERLCIHDLSNPLYKSLFRTMIWLVLGWDFVEESCVRTSTLVPVSPEQMMRLKVLSQYHQLLINLKQKVHWAYTLFTIILITKGYKNWDSGITRIDKMFHIWAHHECVHVLLKTQRSFCLNYWNSGITRVDNIHTKIHHDHAASAFQNQIYILLAQSLPYPRESL